MAKKDAAVVVVDNRIWITPSSIGMTNNPRTNNNQGFSEESMTRLREGIRRDGLNHPLLVRLLGNGKYILVAGERRLRSVMRLVEDDEDAKKNGTERVMCNNPITKKMEPASDLYAKIECKVTDCADDREARRKAIQENTLHEQLTDHELLVQVADMERDKYSRTEQADTLGVSEAHVSQSHSLLASHPRILELMEKGLLTRTAALTFLPIPKDKVEAVLEKAVQLTYDDAEKKELEAVHDKEQALQEIEDGNDKLTIAQFTGDTDKARKARRVINHAGQVIKKADKKISTAHKKKDRKITVETVAAAAKEVDGAGDDLKRPQSMKQIRAIYHDLEELLLKDEIKRPDTGEKFEREHVRILHGCLGFVLQENKAKHPFDILQAIEEDK